MNTIVIVAPKMKLRKTLSMITFEKAINNIFFTPSFLSDDVIQFMGTIIGYIIVGCFIFCLCNHTRKCLRKRQRGQGIYICLLPFTNMSFKFYQFI